MASCHALRIDAPSRRIRRSVPWTAYSCFLSIILVFLVWSRAAFTAGKEWRPKVKETSDADLFTPSDALRSISFPSVFPKPTRMIDDTAVPIVEPTFGRHRAHVDAVLAYAEGYALPYYRMFLETLHDTGFTGDVVMAIAEPALVKPDVVDYLRTHALLGEDDERMHVVVYQTALICEERDGTFTGRRTLERGELDVFQMCRLHHVYGWKDEAGRITGRAEDPRSGRVVATLRYEWYWIWSLQYQPNSWLMLIDARDSFFQTNPFLDLPRHDSTTIMSNGGGILYFFGENSDATRLGNSTKNLKWIRNGYGAGTLHFLEDKPTICSGSTMGEQLAVETYLRAMVNEHDECQVKMTGSDQGFHNYLYYSGKLQQATTIRQIVVFEQGRGRINNLGALRKKSLQEWGIYDIQSHTVYQWDGVTKSPVVHQWDRDNQLHKYIYKVRHHEWIKEWFELKGQQSKQ
jgi:hypothetical protein